MADVPRHGIFVKVCLVILGQIIFLRFFEIFEKVCLVGGVLLGDRDHPSWVTGHVPHTNIASPWLFVLEGFICIWWVFLLVAVSGRITWHEPGWILRWRSREGESRADQNVKTLFLPRLLTY